TYNEQHQERFSCPRSDPIAEYLLVRRRVFVRITPHGTASYGRQLASRFPGTLSKSERQGPAEAKEIRALGCLSCTVCAKCLWAQLNETRACAGSSVMPAWRCWWYAPRVRRPVR